jgi:hypothetical protein
VLQGIQYHPPPPFASRQTLKIELDMRHAVLQVLASHWSKSHHTPNAMGPFRLCAFFADLMIITTYCCTRLAETSFFHADPNCPPQCRFLKMPNAAERPCYAGFPNATTTVKKKEEDNANAKKDAIETWKAKINRKEKVGVSSMQ